MDELMLQGRFAAGSGKRRIPPAAVWQQHRLEEEPTRLDAAPVAVGRRRRTMAAWAARDDVSSARKGGGAAARK
jgi:hypothetical protein